MKNPKHEEAIYFGGWALILFSIFYVALTLLLDHMAQSQTMIYGVEEHMILKITAGTFAARILLTLYALLPLLIIPGAIAVFYSFVENHEPFMKIGMYFAIIGSFALTLSLLMLPSLNWHLLAALSNMSGDVKMSTLATIQALHNYFGVFIGDILGVGCLLVWFFITSLTMMRSSIVPRFLGVIELIIAICATIVLIFRFFEVTQIISTNLQAPGFIALWVFLCGIGLLSLRRDNY